MIDAEHVVWVSRAPMDSTRMKAFTNDLSIANRERAIDSMRRNDAGEPMPPDRFPKAFYVKEPGQKIRYRGELYRRP